MNSLNFESDLKKAIENEYGYFGLKLNGNKDIYRLLLDYLTVYNKIIQPTPRIIKVSQPLQEKLVGHPKKKEVELIAQRLKEGKNVNFFQSKRLLQSNFHDHLLFEWHVYHFHLSAKLDSSGQFFKKTKSLLFSYIDEKQAILLDIDTHRDGVFADEKWLKMLDDYFPEILAPYVDESIKDIKPHITASERQTLWSKGLTMGMTKVNGKIIHSPGIGRATSGHSIIVSKTANEIIRWIKILSDQFTDFGEEICNHFEIDYSDAEFYIQFGKPSLDVVERNSKKTLISFPYHFNIEKNEKSPAANTGLPRLEAKRKRKGNASK